MLRIKGDSEKEGNIDIIKDALQSDDRLYLQKEEEGSRTEERDKEKLSFICNFFLFKIYLQGDCTLILTV